MPLGMENFILNKKQFRMKAREYLLAKNSIEYKDNTAKNPGRGLPKNPYIVEFTSLLTWQRLLLFICKLHAPE